MLTASHIEGNRNQQLLPCFPTGKQHVVQNSSLSHKTCRAEHQAKTARHLVSVILGFDWNLPCEYMPRFQGYSKRRNHQSVVCWLRVSSQRKNIHHLSEKLEDLRPFGETNLLLMRTPV